MAIVRYIIGILVSIYILVEYKNGAGMLSDAIHRMKNDDMIRMLLNGMYLASILIMVGVVFLLLKNLFCLIVTLKYREESVYENKLICAVDILSSINNELMQIVFWSLFVFLGSFAIVSAQTMTEEPLVMYVIGGIFCVVGLALIIRSVISICRIIREHVRAYKEYKEYKES